MCTIHHQLWSVGLETRSKEEDWLKHKKSRSSSSEKLCRDPSHEWWDNRTSKAGPWYPDFKHKVTEESLWIDGCYHLSWVGEELKSRGFALSSGDLYRKNDADASVAGTQDEGAAFMASLRACTNNKDLYRGTRLHDDILKRGLLEKCSDALVTMYAKCGELGKAQALLDMHKSIDVITWTALIAGYAREGRGQNALDCFECMQREGITPNAVTYLCILKACAIMRAAETGTEIHDSIVRQGLLQNNIVLGNALVDMYAKCGALSKAQDVLEKLPSRDVVSWSSLIAGYAQEGQGEQALNCFECMQREGILPDAVTYVCILKACATIGAADKGKEIHDNIERHGLLQNNIVLGNALVDMYAKCGALSKAQDVLEKLPSQDVVSWNALIAGYAQEGQGEQALNCFDHMQREGIPPNAVTYTCILKACVTIGATDKGKEIHDNIARQGLLRNNVVLGTALVDMYAKCGALSKAQDVLEKLPSRDVFSWSALIAGYAQEGQGEQALNCFERMQREGISPNAVTYTCILKACATIGATDKGKQIHDDIERRGLLQNNIRVGTALVDMYAKCRALSEAQDVLEKLPSRDVVSWSALIAGYAREGQGEQALNCFECMQREGISPNAVTYLGILKACTTIGATDEGKEIHDNILRQGLLQNNIDLGNALVDMYAKCGAMSKAQDVLEKLPSRDVVSWNALIAGYAKEGQGEQALNYFERMQREGIAPDAVTFACIFEVCATIGAIDKGKEIHDNIERQGLLQNSIVLGTALVDMYAKCGALSKAQDVLEKLPSRDVVTWSALIAGYAKEGQGEQAMNCFERMQREGIPPNAVTFVCVLNMCSHLGLVEEGHSLFVKMNTKYGVNPNLECYTCIVDLFGRAGHLEKAVRFIQEMPSSDYSAIWLALLGACQKWGDVNVGGWAFKQAIQVDKSDESAYVLMANIYAAAGMQENAKTIETMRIRNKAWKKRGRSWWVDSSKRAHAFSVGDTTHAQSKGIYAKLEDIAHKMSQEGYSAGLHWVLPNISDAAKGHLLCRHSETLALACALINTPRGEIIRIRKNLRMCGDCHVATSLISKIEMRTIIVTDANLRHCFEDGNCSCNDYL